MLDIREPVLAYNRIRINERRTRWLIASFSLALLPVLTAAAVFVMSWVSMIGGAIAHAIYGQALSGKLHALQSQIIASRPAGGPTRLLDLPVPVLLLLGGLLLTALIIVLLITAALISRYGARMVLRMAQARPASAQDAPVLFRAVEALCIGAGLPMPHVHVVESAAPNAFATGRDPQHASLVVTRGLLTLLDRRELEGVVAHELSHIGNHDIRLTTTLAAFVATASLPFRMVEGLFRAAFRLHWIVGAFVSWMAFMFCMSLVQAAIGLATLARDEEFSRKMSGFVWWWSLHGTVASLYALFVAPVVALLIRQSVSRQREFLADADAVLLTRDPEGLALALVKIGASRGERLRVGEGLVHLYFVDPTEERSSLLHAVFPSHPSLRARIELLGRMGSGISPSALEAAIEAGAATRRIEPEASTPAPSLADMPAGPVPPSTNEEAPRVRRMTPLYERADGWSRVLAQLPPDAALTVTGTEGNFIRVTTADHLSGYVSRLSPLAVAYRPATVGPGVHDARPAAHS